MPNSKQIVYLSQAQYAELIANGSITVDGVTVTYDENDIYVTPQAEPVTDVRVAGTSVAANGVANVPIATTTTLGVIKVDSSWLGHLTNDEGKLYHTPPADNLIKAGYDGYHALSPLNQHKATFYGLAKIAGHDEASSTESLGTYTPEAKGAIQQMLGVSDLIATAENTLVASKAYAIGDVFTANGKLYKATTAIAADAAIITDGANANCEETSVGDGFPHDVQVNGVSVVQNGVANIPMASAQQLGTVKPSPMYGIGIFSAGGLKLEPATDEQYKTGYVAGYRAVQVGDQHKSVFYGLAKASGDTTQSASSNAVGTYTDNAKAAIKSMLGIVDGSTGTVDVTGTTPTITAVENTRYVCGEVTSLDFTPAASGICIVRFTSGSSVTVLTIPNTVKFPEWFDPTSLETNTIYDICVTDGIYGAVMSWAL